MNNLSIKINPAVIAVLIIAGIFWYFIKGNSSQHPLVESTAPATISSPQSSLTKNLVADGTLLGSFLTPKTQSIGGTPSPYQTGIIWYGMYYKGAQFPSESEQRKELLSSAKKFSTLTECMRWGRMEIMKNPADAFECAYGCRFEEKINSVVCKDTTKAITKDRFSPQLP